MEGNALRMVKIAAIVMGVLIVVGTVTLMALLARRGAPAAEAGPQAPSRDPVAAILDEPPGTRIAGIASARERIAVHLTGGGADRIVLIDPATGAVAGRVALAR
jgi:voltage-gated potassium channel Kch